MSEEETQEGGHDDEEAEVEEVEAVEETPEEVPEEPEEPEEDDGSEGSEDPEMDVPDDVERTDGCKSCGAPEDDMLVVYDRNMDKPWSGGNPYSRICPECGSRTFAPKDLWKTQAVPYVIERGSDEPKPYYTCPYDDCDGQFVGEVDECPECERELIWE